MRALALAAAALLPAAALSPLGAAAGDSPWDEIRGRHFIVRHRGDPGLAGAVLDRAERDYARIAGELGYVRHGDFWLWDRRVSIRVYPDHATFVRECAAPAWAAGKADRRAREISGVGSHALFLDSFLPHELAHLIFRDFIGEQAAIPLWLEEGVAQWAEAVERPSLKARTLQLARENRLLKAAELAAADVRVQPDGGAARDFYAQSASLAGFLIRAGGSDRFAALCRQLRAGKRFDEALAFTYPENLRTMEAVERRWLNELTKEAP